MPEQFDHKLMTALFDKRFGKSSPMVDLEAVPAQGAAGEYLPTGSIALNLALGVGGLKKGTVNEIYGQESSGKSTLVTNIMAIAQKLLDGPVVLIDSEHAFNKDYAVEQSLSLDKDKLIIVQESETESALNMVQFFAERGVSLIVVDSVASLVPKDQLEGDSVDAKFGGNSKYLSTHLPKMISVCAKTDTIVIYVNQIREKVGVVFGNPETTPGGRAMRFYASLRIETRIKEQIKDSKGDVIGIRPIAKIVKNKIGGAPYRKASYPILFGKGIDVYGDLADTGVELGLVENGGGRYKFGTYKAHGRASFLELLEQTPEAVKALTDTIWSSAV